MNVFKLNEDPTVAAMLQNDKHVVKMATEYAQLLSTAHRVLDGEMYVDRTANNRRIKRWRMADDVINYMHLSLTYPRIFLKAISLYYRKQCLMMSRVMMLCWHIKNIIVNTRRIFLSGLTEIHRTL